MLLNRITVLFFNKVLIYPINIQRLKIKLLEYEKIYCNYFDSIDYTFGKC